MKYPIAILFFLCTLFISYQVNAQGILSTPESASINITDFESFYYWNDWKGSTTNQLEYQKTNNGRYLSKRISIPLEEITPFLAFSLTWEANNWSLEKAKISVRFIYENSNELMS